MKIIIYNEANLNIFQLHALFGECLRHTFPDDNGDTVFPEWTNRDGITVVKAKDGFIVMREVG